MWRTNRSTFTVQLHYMFSLQKKMYLIFQICFQLRFSNRLNFSFKFPSSTTLDRTEKTFKKIRDVLLSFTPSSHNLWCKRDENTFTFCPSHVTGIFCLTKWTLKDLQIRAAWLKDFNDKHVQLLTRSFLHRSSIYYYYYIFFCSSMPCLYINNALYIQMLFTMNSRWNNENIFILK